MKNLDEDLRALFLVFLGGFGRSEKRGRKNRLSVVYKVELVCVMIENLRYGMEGQRYGGVMSCWKKIQGV